jgi:hypothetical protein
MPRKRDDYKCGSCGMKKRNHQCTGSVPESDEPPFKVTFFSTIFVLASCGLTTALGGKEGELLMRQLTVSRRGGKLSSPSPYFFWTPTDKQSRLTCKKLKPWVNITFLSN